MYLMRWLDSLPPCVRVLRVSASEGESDWVSGRVGGGASASQRARAPVGSDDPLNRLLEEVFHVLFQFASRPAPILADVHRHAERDVVALREVRGRVKKLVTTNDVVE